ncbi:MULTISPECIES: hypothetical protein [unclassified Streptomyces]|uniref:hypothetical protein n=1 Tax=unclassified Streptomyces TaxID=2593676 RepID=UPI00278BEEB1|nr:MULTISPECIES: hypothetical protein [unclassified Streptomyces]
MKDALLDLNATVATVLDVATWIWIGAVLFLTGFAAWLLIATARRAIAAIRRANHIVDAARDDLIAHQELDAHLTDCWQQYADDTRKETQ